MDFLQKEEKRFVRVLIGMSKTGSSSMTKPFKSINVINTTPEKLYNKIKKMIEKEKKND